MRKGDIVEGEVEEIRFPNKGIIHCGDVTVIVKNSVPGQKVRCFIRKIRKKTAEAQVLDIIERAPNELKKPACIHFGICGGCVYQNLSYEDQLRLKENQIKNLLINGLGHLPVGFEGTLASPRIEGYRNKMEFTFGDEVKGGPLRVGMHERGSFYDILYVSKCKIMDEDFREILACTQEYFSEIRLPFYHRMKHEGILRHLLVRRAEYTGDIFVGLVATSALIDRDDLLNAYARRICDLELKGSIAGVAYIKNDSLADAVIDEGTKILYGRDYITESLFGLNFKITPFSFFQTNTSGAKVLYTKIREYVGILDHSLIYDLYSGTGTIAQILSPVADRVIGVEIVEEAVKAARENAQTNDLLNCEFICGDVLRVLDEMKEVPDFIVLDPPRDGVHPKALSKILSYGVERMVYVSCKPTSLVRDLKVIYEEGYRIEKWAMVDMFPFTANIETVCLLSNTNRKPDDVLKVTIDVDKMHEILDREKAEKEAKEKSE